VIFFSTTFVCNPTRKLWDLEAPGKCLNVDIIWPFNASLNILMDFLLIALPFPAIRKLNLPLKTRRALIIAFSLGGSGCVISIMRLYSIISLSETHDRSWKNAETAIWSSAEANIGLICACLPALRPLLPSGWFGGWDKEEESERSARMDRILARLNEATSVQRGGQRQHRGAYEYKE
jgi:hypothetical protein